MNVFCETAMTDESSPRVTEASSRVTEASVAMTILPDGVSADDLIDVDSETVVVTSPPSPQLSGGEMIRYCETVNDGSYCYAIWHRDGLTLFLYGTDSTAGNDDVTFALGVGLIELLPGILEGFETHV